jgi:hypothetical protein
MKRMDSVERATRIGAACAFGLALCLAAAAEAGAPTMWGPQLSPEKAKAAWAIQAKGVATDLGLGAKDSAKLLDAYTQAREAFLQILKEATSEGGGRGRMQAYLEMIQTGKTGLETALKEILTDEQAATAIKSLGAFSTQWDTFVDQLAGYGLSEEKMTAAVKLTREFIVGFGKVVEEAMAAQDREAAMAGMKKLKGDLDAGLADILTEEQMAQWKKATPDRFGRGGQRPRGQGGGGGE